MFNVLILILIFRQAQAEHCVPLDGFLDKPASEIVSTSELPDMVTSTSNTNNKLYCNSPCYIEYEPEPAMGDTADPSACLTALSCADNPPSDCIRSEFCDDYDPCTVNDFTSYIIATDEVCFVCEGEPVVVASNTGQNIRYSCIGEIMSSIFVNSQNEVNWFDEAPTINSMPIHTGPNFDPLVQGNAGINSPATFTYWVNTRNGNCISGYAEINYEVLPINNPPSIAAMVETCLDAPFTINEDINANLIWYTDIDLNNRIFSGAGFNPVLNGGLPNVAGSQQIYWVVDDANGCTSSPVEVTFLINNCTTGCTDADPIAPIINSIFLSCNDNVIDVLEVEIIGNGYYTLDIFGYNADGSSIPLFNQSYTINGSDEFAIAFEDLEVMQYNQYYATLSQNDCVSEQTEFEISLVGLEVETPTVDGETTYTICPGVDLPEITIQTESPNYTINWVDALTQTTLSGIPNPVDLNDLVDTGQLGNYIFTVTATLDECESEDLNIFINIEEGNTPSPIADFEIPDGPYCTNHPFELINTSSNATSYQWMLEGADPALANTTNVTVNFLTTSPQPYELTLIAIGCEGADTITKVIDVFMTPILNGLPDINACPNAEVVFNAAGNNISTFIWEPDEDLINSTTGNPRVNISEPTTFTVIGVSDQGCASNPESFTVDVVNFPDYDYSVIANNTCLNEPVELNAASASGAVTFAWTGTNLPLTPGAQQFVIPLNDTTSYVLTAFFANCEIQSEPTQVILKSLPNASIVDDIDPNIVCIGESVNLQVESTEVESYSWFPGDFVSDLRGQNVNWLVNDAGLNSIQVEITGFNGCIDTLTYQAETSIYPETLLSNDSPTVCNGDTTLVLLSDANFDAGFVIYTVTPGTSAEIRQDSLLLYPTQDTNYTITANFNACLSNIDLSVEFVECEVMPSINEFTNFSARIYPNPATHLIYLDVKNSGNYSTSIFDLGGKMLLSEKNESTIDIQVFSEGIYLLEIEDVSSKSKLVEKIMIRR